MRSQSEIQRFTLMDQILPFTNIKKNSRHLRISTNSALPTFLPHSDKRKSGGGICSYKKLTLIKILARDHTTESLPLRRPWLSLHPEAPTTPLPPEITPDGTKVILQAPLPRATPKLLSVPKTSPSGVIYSPRFLTSPQKSSVVTTEISACNYVTSSLLRWRCVMPLHSRRTVMDNEEIFCMQY